MSSLKCSGVITTTLRLVNSKRLARAISETRGIKSKMGNRYTPVPEKYVGLSLKQKKALWNKAAYERKKALEAMADNDEHFKTYCKAIRPYGVTGEHGTRPWFKSNDKSFKRGLWVALMKLKAEEGNA